MFKNNEILKLLEEIDGKLSLLVSLVKNNKLKDITKKKEGK